MLNERRIPTRTATTRWERSTVWGMLRNPAYCGKACYGKTELRPRQRITRPLRQRNGVASRDSANHERPRQKWIEMPVPPLVSEEVLIRPWSKRRLTFAPFPTAHVPAIVPRHVATENG
jgi:site-specific DNA recombinase